MGSYRVLPNQVFPCFHGFGKTTPTHMNTLCNEVIFRGSAEGNVTKLSHVTVVH